MKTLPLIVFDVNETLLDLDTMTPIFERIFREKEAMRLCGRSGLFGPAAGAMSGLLGSIATNGHAAPAAGAAVGSIEEQQGARGTFTCLHVEEVFIADEVADRPRNGQ